MNRPLRVLAIDGGGTRGLFPATILHELEKTTGKPVTELFDVIVGSATGGIITMGLAAGLPIAEIAAIYRDQAGFILPASFWRRLWNPLNLFAPKYPAKNLQQLLTDKLGAETTMADVHARFGNDTIFLTSALDMSPELVAGEAPAFNVVVYNSSQKGDGSEKLVDLAMRTSAAAVNLPLYGRFGEAGNFANDPTMIGLAFCLNSQRDVAEKSHLPEGASGLGVRPEDIRFLSLGCGSGGSSYVPRDKIGKGRWGLLKWFGRLTSLVIMTNMVANQYYMRQLLNQEQYFRLSAYYKAPDAPPLLKDKKLKIDVTDTDQLLAIEAYARKIFTDKRSALRGFLEV